MALHGAAMLLNQGGYSGYQIDQSMLLDGSSDYLTRTFGTPTSATDWTWSFWIKRAKLGSDTYLISTGTDTTPDTLRWRSDDDIDIHENGSVSLRTNRKFRDTGSWFHVVLRSDADNATNSEKVRLYINGEEETSFATDARGTYPGSSWHTFNSAIQHTIGRRGDGNRYFDGYLAEFIFVDGQSLAPTTFGEFYIPTQWRPIQPSGLSYGNNGFYLNFSNPANLGVDYSGNGNDWTENGSPVQSSDSPTVNVCTYNALQTASAVTLSNGNRTAAHGAFSSNGGTYGTIALASGKWYWETTIDALSSGSIFLGVVAAGDAEPHTTAFANESTGFAYRNNGQKRNNNTDTAYGGTYTSSDVIGVALDLENGAIWFSKNGTWQASATVGEIEAGTTTNAAYTGLSGELVPADMNGTSGGTYTATVSFAEDEWTYTAPTGFKAITAANLPDPTITDPGEYFNAVAYTGDGTAIGSGGQAITGVGFQSDFTWIKNRDNTNNHVLFDVLRGATNNIRSNTTEAEVAIAESLASFDADGFTVGSNGIVNSNTNDYISWNWKAGGAGVPNTDGTISSTVSVNDDAGFSIVSYTGTGSAATVGHGQSAAPEMIICKNLTDAVAWCVYHNGVAADPETDYLVLNGTGAAADDSTLWNDIAPTSSVFSVGSSNNVNGSTDEIIAYCFRSIPGYSKVGSLELNNSTDGTFVFLGFKPALFLMKMTASGHWGLWDDIRNPFNVSGTMLRPNTNNPDLTGYDIDILSNGVKIRDNHAQMSSGTAIFYAVARHPFGGSNIPLGLAQ